MPASTTPGPDHTRGRSAAAARGRYRRRPMELFTRVEKGQGEADRLFLLVHGLGADENDLAALVGHLDPGGRFVTVLPRAPEQYGPGYRWYEFGGEGIDADSFATALDALDATVEAACEEHGLRREEAIFAGFSQGASLVLTLGLRRDGAPHPAGIYAMSGFLPDVAGVELDWDAELPPVLVQHGSQDPMLPVSLGRGVAETLADRGVPVVYGEYPMGHQVALESIQQGAGWLEQVLAGERPSEPLAAPASEGSGEEDGGADDGPVKTVTSRTFEQEVLRSDVPVVVDFWAPWCGPCRQVAPVVEQMAVMREGSYKFVKCNIDENPDVAQAFDVQSIPMIGLFRDGRLERQSLGAKPRPQLEADLGMLVIP